MKWLGMFAGVLLAAGLFHGPARAAAPVERKFTAVVTRIDAQIEPAEVRRGQTVNWKFTVELSPGWHTYPTEQPNPKVSSSITEFDFAKATGPGRFTGQPSGPLPLKKSEPNLGEVLSYEGATTWVAPVVIPTDAPVGEASLRVPVRLTVCDEKGCLPPKIVEVTARFKVSDAPPVAEAAPPSPALPAVVAPAPAPSTTPGLAGFLLTAAFWGFVTLLTPCVFPMIPITVSLFLSKGDKAHISPVRLALIYCGTIILVLGLSAWLLLSVFRQLSVSPVTNIALGVLFMALAMSLFGAFDLTLPKFLTRWTSAREGRGVVLGTVFMALTFTIVSFTCVAPFLGGFAALADTQAAAGSLVWLRLALGGLVFAATFASPFFVLALFPSLLKKLPRSGDWLNRVKVVMGIIEVAAALKFFRTAELRILSPTEYFTYDLVLGAWVALAILAGLYLFNLVRIGHGDEERSVGAGSLLFGAAFLSLGIYLLPALIHAGEEARPRPAGVVYAWVDSFLLRDPTGGDGDLTRALAEARRDGKLVFVDFTGVTCTNCKLNEENVFPRPAIRGLLDRYKVVQLYTDDVPQSFYPSPVTRDQRRSDAAKNLDFQKQQFQTEQLPLYVILEPLPDGKFRTVDKYDEGKINDIDGFAEFLRRPLTGPKSQTMTAAR
jgi:thiol:disulfide interchange protein DsbD